MPSQRQETQAGESLEMLVAVFDVREKQDRGAKRFAIS